MICTTRVDTQPRETLILTLKLKRDFSYSEASEHLAQIILSHNEKDWLSNRLRSWGHDLLMSTAMSEGCDFTSIAQQAKTRLERLFRQVFLHPDFRQPMVTHLPTPPQIVEMGEGEEEIFAQNDLELIRSTTRRCPCHHRQALASRVHVFAKEILEWVDTLPISIQFFDDHREIATLNELDKTIYYFVLEQSAQSNRIEREAQACVNKMKKDKEAILANEERRVWAAEAKDGVVARVQILLDEQDRRLNDALQSLETKHRDEMDAMANRIESLEQEIAELKRRMVAAEGSIQQLQHRIAVAEAEIAALQNQDNGNSCIIL